MEVILGALGTLLWSLFSIIFTVIDMIQGIFQAFAGTGTVYIDGNVVGSGNTGDLYDTGIIYYFLQSDLVINMFLSILYLAIILLVVFTVMAVLKNMYQPTPKKWQEIIASAIKGLGLFIFVPACSLLGVWLGNILLVAIDGATQNTGYATTISRRLFISSAYTANHIRLDATGVDWQTYSNVAELCDKCGIEIRAFPGGENSGEIDPDYEYYASLVDDCFATGIPSVVANWDVSPWYNLIEINYLLLAAGGIFILYVLGAITFGMVKRLFILVILFIISPAMCAMYPIDEGNAYKTWAGEFKKNLLSAYGAVAGMNLFFSVAPMIEMISIPKIGDALGLLPLALTVAGLYVVKDFISLVAGFVGGGNAYVDGAGLMTSVNARRKQATGVINKGSRALIHGTSSAFAAGKAAHEAGGSGFGAFFRSASSSILKTVGSGLNTLSAKGTGLDFKGMKESVVSDDERKKIRGRENLRQAAKTEQGLDSKKYFIDDEGAVRKSKMSRKNQKAYEWAKEHMDGGVSEHEEQRYHKKTRRKHSSYDDMIKYAEEAGIDVDKFLKDNKLISREDMKSNKKTFETIDRSATTYKTAAENQTAMATTINTTDFSAMASSLGISADIIRARMLEGKEIRAEELPTYRGTRRNAQLASLDEYNRQAGDMAQRRDATSSASSELLSAMRELKGLEISEDSINSLANELKESLGNNTSSAGSVDTLIRTIKDSSTTQESKITKAIEDAAKDLLRELKKNTEETKPKDKK